MEMDLKKVFFVIVCITMIGVISLAVATPIKTKINDQKTVIPAIQFAP